MTLGVLLTSGIQESLLNLSVSSTYYRCPLSGIFQSHIHHPSPLYAYSSILLASTTSIDDRQIISGQDYYPEFSLLSLTVYLSSADYSPGS